MNSTITRIALAAPVAAAMLSFGIGAAHAGPYQPASDSNSQFQSANDGLPEIQQVDNDDDGPDYEAVDDSPWDDIEQADPSDDPIDDDNGNGNDNDDADEADSGPTDGGPGLAERPGRPSGNSSTTTNKTTVNKTDTSGGQVSASDIKTADADVASLDEVETLGRVMPALVVGGLLAAVSGGALYRSYKGRA